MKKVFFTVMLLIASLLAWADNSVTVSYNGNTATVTIDDNLTQYLTVTQSGAHVSITQSSDVEEEITYTLTGASNDGEFYMSGSYKATIELNGLTLTNTTPVYSGAAVHIQNGKRINVKVITGTTNTLVDAASGSQKGCLYVKGHAEFKQKGTLNIVGNVKHGIKAGEYISVKNATINITSAVGDGISCNQYFLMESGSVSISGTGDDGLQCDLDGETSTGMTVDHEDEDSGNVYVSGGTITINCPAAAAKGIKSAGDVYISDNANINITTTGKGTWDTTDLEAKAACGLNADGNITISGGTLTLTATGSGGKGMSCDNILTISGGDITVSTTGGLYYNNGSNEYLNYTGNTDHINNSYYCSPKGVKAGTKTTSGYNTTYSGGIDISGGTISVTTTGNNAEGIESKNYLNITGGQVTVDAHDDGINSAQDLTITDGYVYSRGSNNDGIDANGNVYIQGGLIYAVGASSPEVAIDANSEENKKLYFTGGTLIALGGLERGSSISQTCYQASWSANRWYSMTFGTTVIAFKTPASGGSTMVVSASSTPTLKSGVTVSGGNGIFGGRCFLDATTTGGSNVTLSQYNSGGGNPPGQNYSITATANPQEAGNVSGAGTYPRNAICTLTATANSGYTFVNWTRNGSVVSTNATYSFQVTGNASFVAHFAEPVTIPDDAIEIGQGTGTSNYLPTYNYYKYSLTQQIYTADEIGVAGTITSIAFYNAGAAKTRTLDFYLKPTDKSAFTSKTDWIAVAASDKVFSGSVTMAANTWTFVTFSTPFEYDGSSNLVLVTDDNTNAWTSSPHMACSVFSTGSSQALYAYNDNTNYNPMSPPTSSVSNNNVLSMKNHILLTIGASEPQAQQQTITLSPGWNWCSTYIEQEGIDGLGQLESSIAIPKVVIQSKNDGYVRSLRQNGQIVWQGALTSINNEEMYKIGTKVACEATMEGEVANLANHPITISRGWNWIGFPCSQSVSVSEALSGFTPRNGDVIKGMSGYATFSNGTWSGTLNTLEPGQGYMYGSRSNATKTLVFPTGSRGNATIANITPENNYYQPATDYADNMTLIAVVELNGEELRSEGYELVAFAGDECRGSVKLMYVESLNRYVAFLTVFGDEAEGLHFVLTDGADMSLSADHMTYATDGIKGSLDNPVTLRFGVTDVNLSVYPNPSKGQFTVEGTGMMRITNVLGQVMMAKEIAERETVDLPKGMYFVTMNGSTVKIVVE